MQTTTPSTGQALTTTETAPPVLVPGKDFTGRSTGVIFTHMCDVHGMKPFSCRKCDFTSKNKTLMYNHETRYCHKLGNKRSD